MLKRILALFTAITAFFTVLSDYGIKTAFSDNVWNNAAYGSGEREVLDLVIPKNASGETGLILEIHGGAWIGGNKDGYKSTIASIANTYGYAAAAINYTYISDSSDMNHILDEITMALSFIKAKAAEKGVDINKVILTGHSAGAHLSLLYAYSRADEAPVKPAAVVSFAGPTDLTKIEDYTALSLADSVLTLLTYATGQPVSLSGNSDGVTALLSAISPVSYVNASTVPTIICHGEKDTVVPFSQAGELDAALTENGVEHEFFAYPNSDHDLDSDSDVSNAAYAKFAEYAQTYLK